ncbi:27161_t:CDS:2 [Gigaspora margarita]|uniref:27161_t:CDS:1 n=1 Tax=Gigaspora margarita TaxID=4874 RepID=A0ABM8VW05_GIGMA|nr:27161_t:CDS:2 [Gigaspora margarita]
MESCSSGKCPEYNGCNIRTEKILVLKINKSKHSYLYTEPYEPIVHGTFGIDQPEPLDMFIIQYLKQIIKNSFYIKGFGHPDYDEIQTKLKRRTNKKYIEAQLKAYISRLNSDRISINPCIEQPNSADHKKWSDYIQEAKKYSEEMRRNADWVLVGVLINQTNMIMQLWKNKKFKDENKCKKDLMTNLTNSIPDNISVTQFGRCKQVYDHIFDLILKLEDQKIPMKTWYPLLNKAGITYRFLHDSNFKKKKKFNLYEEFIDLLVSKCKKSLTNAVQL